MIRPAGSQSVVHLRPTPALLRLVLVAALALTTGTVLAGPAEAATLPPGFSVQNMPSGQANTLTDFSFAPDGSYFTTGKNGRVAWVSTAGKATTLATVPVVTATDLGLTGIAVANDYANSRQIYLVRTVDVGGKRMMRLSAWTVAGTPPTSLAGERVIWDLPNGSEVHAITGILAAGDGTLWVTIGDSADFLKADPLALRALDTAQGYGKLLHVNPDGSGVGSNPFFDPAAPGSWKSRVYASGFRSPFRLSLDPSTGRPVVGDVGWNRWEEIDVVRPGASYGWPCWEGATKTPGYATMPGCQGVANTAPLYTYPHGPQGTAVTGGIVYTGTAYPAAYRGAYFFGDYSAQRVYTLRYANGALTRKPEAAGFGTGNGAPVKFAAAPNGDVVYADILGAVLKRLVYAAGNRPPTPSAVVRTDPATRTVTFDGSGSKDLDGGPLTFAWNFGDGAKGTGAKVTHVYAAGGPPTLTATLTVTDAQRAKATTKITVAPANNVPVIKLKAPPADHRFAVGEPVKATATAHDAEDGNLPVTWSVVLVHCSAGLCHTHPGETSTGPAFNEPFTDHGPGTHLEIRVTATDSLGVRAQAKFSALPSVA